MPLSLSCSHRMILASFNLSRQDGSRCRGICSAALLLLRVTIPPNTGADVESGVRRA